MVGCQDRTRTCVPGSWWNLDALIERRARVSRLERSEKGILHVQRFEESFLQKLLKVEAADRLADVAKEVGAEGIGVASPRLVDQRQLRKSFAELLQRLDLLCLDRLHHVRVCLGVLVAQAGTMPRQVQQRRLAPSSREASLAISDHIREGHVGRHLVFELNPPFVHQCQKASQNHWPCRTMHAASGAQREGCAPLRIRPAAAFSEDHFAIFQDDMRYTWSVFLVHLTSTRCTEAFQ
mmetsp:Transcript_78659/g.163553  ORF Transcript_78659/g.163553 Transcript_78659/m.163553 type:complete len:237 (+) Transcript_78659:1139-1849(+)